MIFNWDIRQRLIDIQHSQKDQSHQLESMLVLFNNGAKKLVDIEEELDEILAVLKQLYAKVIGEELILKFEQKGTAMAGKKTVSLKMHAKGSSGAGSRAVMPPVDWTSQLGTITFQLIDAAGNPVPAPNAADVTTTLVAVDDSGNPSPLVTVSPGADSLNYSATNTGVAGKFTFQAGLAFVSGSPGPFTAEQSVNIPSGPPSDLVIKFGQ